MVRPPPLPWKIRTDPERTLLIFAAASAVVGGGLWAAHVLGVALPPCLWKRLTGLPCVGCGGTRAMDLLRHGEVLTALTMNPGAVAGVLGLGLLGLYAAGVLWFRLEPLRPVARSGRIIRLVFFAVLVINWVYLLLAGRA